jgi:predicted metal-binding membrane protein
MPFKANSASSPDAALRATILALALAAWCALWMLSRSPSGHLFLHGSAHVHLAAERPAWFVATFVGGWTLMTVAMMLPTSLPLMQMFHRMVRGRASAPRLVGILVVGYLFVWVLCGVLLFAMNALLHAGLSLHPSLTAIPWIATATILAIAGLYQFSSLKYACLDKCRSPMSFLMGRWRGGNESLQALRIGTEHGLFCVGCCWSLMLLMFVVSSASLLWMLVLGVVMAVEKNVSWGRRLSAPIGALLLVASLAVVIVGTRA